MGLRQDLIILNGAVWWTLHQSSIETKNCSIEVGFGSRIIQKPGFGTIRDLAGDKGHEKLRSLVCREDLVLEEQFSMKIEGVLPIAMRLLISLRDVPVWCVRPPRWV